MSTPVNPSTETTAAGQTPTPTPEAPKSRFNLPPWAFQVLAGVALLFLARSIVWHMNDNKPFSVSDKLDHQGPWYRQAALAPVDWFKSREYFVVHDFWGNKQVLLKVGDRHFLQAKSGEPAVELISNP